MSTCVSLSAVPVPGTVSAIDVETSLPLVVTAHAYNPLLYYVNAAKGRAVAVTYESPSVAQVAYTPPPQTIDAFPPPTPVPGQPTSTTTIKDVFETLAAWHGPCLSYAFNGNLIQRAAFVTLSHDPYVGWPSYDYQISCMYEHPRAGAITALVKSNVYQSHEGRTVRLQTLSRIMTGHTQEALVLAGAQVAVAYKREVVTITPAGAAPPPPPRQPGCSAKITATYQDGSQAGVTAQHTISVSDCAP